MHISSSHESLFEKANKKMKKNEIISRMGTEWMGSGKKNFFFSFFLSLLPVAAE